MILFRNILSIVLLSILKLYSGDASASDNIQLGGIYLDSFTGVGLKVGYAYVYGPEINSSQSLAYIDIDAGTKARKITAGIGVLYTSGGNLRLGVSYAERNSDPYIGLEAVLSIWFASAKIGAYHNRTTNNEHLAVGVGFGF